MRRFSRVCRHTADRSWRGSAVSDHRHPGVQRAFVRRWVCCAGKVKTFTAAIALAVGAIPEGLPTAVTITLAIGAFVNGQAPLIDRRLPAVKIEGCAEDDEMMRQSVWTPR